MIKHALLTALLLSAACLPIHAAPPSPPAKAAAKPTEDPVAAAFETYLKAHPADSDRRAEAMNYYGKRPGSIERLKLHTLQMIQNRPGDIHIFTDNVAAYYRDPAYRAKAIAALEAQVLKDRVEHGVYWNLALLCQHGAVPPIREGSWSRDEFLKHYGLPADTKLPTSVDRPLAEKAIRYYRLAMALADEDAYYFSFYSEQLANLLRLIGRPADAVKVFEAAMPKVDDHEKPSFLVSYGSALRDLQRLDDAVGILNQVRAADKTGSSAGPGYPTALAETELGLIALGQGRTTEAIEHLQASCAMRPFTASAMPLRLARKLLSTGETASVIDYCRTVIDKFAPGQQEAKDLLKQALKAAG
jgi:tetratricopeptide (TPR) repeat protein